MIKLFITKSRDFRSMFSEGELTFTFAICCRPPVCRLCVWRLSVTLVHRTQAVEIFGKFLRHLVPRPSADIHETIYGDRPRGTPPSGELNTTGVAKYSDFWPIEGYISETRCKIGRKLVLITYRKLHMSIRLVPKLVTLNDVERRNGRYFALFHRIRQLLGVLLKSVWRYT